MSLYKDASLVMIPSAYKDGKLYSIRPTDGSGDFTFSRGSNLAATRVDVNGLIEKGRENLLPHSNTFSSWNATALLNTPTTGITGYDGTSNAWKIIPNTTNTSHRVWYPSLGLGDAVYTFSVYAKSGGYSTMYLYCNSTGADFAGWFDLSAGTTGSGTGRIDTTITDVGSGWYRCTLTGLEDLSSLEIYVGDGTESIVFAGDGTSSLYIQDAQLEAGLVATDYIETGASTAQAGILEDMPRLDYSGGASCPALLLEPQRTNLVVNSEYSVNSWGGVRRISPIANAGTSPEGLNNATKIDETAVNGTHMFDYNFTATSGVTYTFSYFAKAGERNQCYLFGYTDGGVFSSQRAIFDLSNGTIVSNVGNGIADIKPFNDGWYRVSLTLTAQASSQAGYWGIGLALDSATSYLGVASNGIYMYGFQHEAGSYPTSYIPTYGSSVTRSYDFMNVSGLNADVFNNDNFTLLYDFDYNADGREGSTTAYRIFSSSSQLGIKGTSGTARSLQIFSSGDFSGTINFNGAEASRIKVALRVTNGTCELFFNGAKDSETIDVSGAAPYNWGVIQVTASSSINTSLNQCVGFPTALTDSECIALTTL